MLQKSLNADEGPVEPGIEVWRTSAYASLRRPASKSIANFDRFGTSRGRPHFAQSAYETTTALVIDPGLQTEGGHNYSALLRVKAELSKLNVEHTCLASMVADAAVRKLAEPLLPTKGLWWRSHYTRSEFRQHVEVMRGQLSFALNAQKRPPDLLVLHCCDSVQICAVAEYYGRPSQVPAPHLLIWLLFPPDHFKQMGTPSMAAEIDEYREAFAALRGTIGDDRKITVFCETAALAAAYSGLIGLNVDVAPGPNLAVGAKEIRQKKQPTARIVALGHANKAKGYHLLPEAIEQVLSSDSRATFFVQGILQNTDATGGSVVLEALSRMGPSVATSTEVLTGSEYLSRLLEADVLLLPYDSEVYETRGSGLFNEAREIGIPVVATRGCAFAQPAFDEGWGIEVVERSGAGLAQAILAALDRLPDLSARAEEAAAQYRADDVGTILRKVVGDIRPDERSVRAVAQKHLWEQPLPNTFFSCMRLQEGASLLDEASPGVTSSVSRPQTGRESAITLMMGRLINTSSVPYRYSVVLNTDPRELWKLPAHSHVLAEISVEVTAGKVGVAWADENHEILDGAERYAPTMPGLQRLIVPIPAERAHQLVFRNFAAGSVPTSFRVLELRATLQNSVDAARLDRPTLRATKAPRESRETTHHLPDTLFTSIRLLEGAVVRDEPQADMPASAPRQQSGGQSAIALMVRKLIDASPVPFRYSIASALGQHISGRPAIASVVGKIIDTSSAPYRYSVVLETDAGEASPFAAGDCVTAEISVEVISGMVGAAWIDKRWRILDGIRSHASAMPGIQRLVIPLSSNRGRRLVLWNCASDPVPASFRLLGITAQIHSCIEERQGGTGG